MFKVSLVVDAGDEGIKVVSETDLMSVNKAFREAKRLAGKDAKFEIAGVSRRYVGENGTAYISLRD